MLVAVLGPFRAFGCCASMGSAGIVIVSIRIGPVGGRVPAEVLVAADAEARIYSVGRSAVVTYVFGHHPSARVETSPWSALYYDSCSAQSSCR